MVSGNRVHNFFRFATPSCDFRADFRVRPLHLLIHGLSDVVQHAAALGELDIQSQFRRHRPRKVGDLNGVLKLVLAIAGSELQPPEAFDLARVQIMYPHIEGGSFAGVHDHLFHLFCALLDDFFDAAGMDAAVADELLHGATGHLAPDAVEPADDNHAGRIIHDHVHARGLLEGADVAPFAADDAALHVVVRQFDGSDDAFSALVGGVALYGDSENLAGLALGALLGLGHVPGHHFRAFLLQLSLKPTQQELLRLLAPRRALVEQLPGLVEVWPHGQGLLKGLARAVEALGGEQPAARGTVLFGLGDGLAGLADRHAHG